ncbi:hypothetical protein H6504_01965 [Candidatus Woesearchaeota archaeon]|nr:hypothetical protein [Candidatus Woesearchaeota archaeon]
MLLSTAKGNVLTNMVVYIILIIVGMYFFYWFITSNPAIRLSETDKLEQDVGVISRAMAHACTADAYTYEASLQSDVVNLTMTKDDICLISASGIRRCKMLTCEGEEVSYIGSAFTITRIGGEFSIEKR